LTLQEYLSDNLNLACPLVGFDKITEFRPSGECKTMKKRPYYHCSIEDCFNEQGNSRQMMEHLVRRHHAEGWVKSKGLQVPKSHSSLVELCKTHAENPLSATFVVKVIKNDDLWYKCKKAKLRLNEDEANNLFNQINLEASSDTQKRMDTLPSIELEDAVSSISIEMANTKENELAESPNKQISDHDDTESLTKDPDGLDEGSSVHVVTNPYKPIRESPRSLVKFNSSSIDEVFNNLTELKHNESFEVSGNGDTVVTEKSYNESFNQTSVSVSAIEKEQNLTGDIGGRRIGHNSDEIEIVGSKEGYSKSTSGEPSFHFKKETKSENKPNDMLERQVSNDEDITVEFASKAPPLNPEFIFKDKVAKAVKHTLFKYYSKDENDKNNKDGTPKDIRIRSEQEFSDICRNFSQRFRKEIEEAYLAFNETLDGIEKIDVQEYGISHDIEKHFS